MTMAHFMYFRKLYVVSKKKSPIMVDERVPIQRPREMREQFTD